VLVALLVFSAAAGACVPCAAAGLIPVLGHPWGPYQEGYGEPHPTRIFNGGDPTGLVRDIRWQGWGNSTAIGYGISTYVWPGTGVAANGPVPGARVVAFHLGSCRGRPSYNAVEWYFPRYGESFDPYRYINTCTGAYVGVTPHESPCPAVPLAHGRVARNVTVIHMRCTSARRLIASAPVARYLRSGGRFVLRDFRCGSNGLGLGTALFECQHGQRELAFEVAP
jgi:hypothetical protein